MVETGGHPPLRFVVVGGGPTGVELAGAISRHLQQLPAQGLPAHRRRQDRGGADRGRPHILPSYPEDLQAKAVEQLKQLGVKVITGKQVTDVEPGYVIMGAERIEALVTLWAAGVQASPLGKLLGVPVNRRGA